MSWLDDLEASNPAAVRDMREAGRIPPVYDIDAEAEQFADQIQANAILIARGAPVDLHEPDEEVCRRCGALTSPGQRYCGDCDLEMTW